MFRRLGSQGLAKNFATRAAPLASAASIFPAGSATATPAAMSGLTTQRCFQSGGPGALGRKPPSGAPSDASVAPGQGGEPPQPPPPPTKPEGEPKHLKITTDEKGITTVALNRGPVNSLSMEVLEELNNWMVWLGYDDAVKSVILTSNLATVFSAGLDINELHNPSPERFAKFWTNLQEIWLILNTFPKPCVAAINGNSPAGGCMLALCADIRVMAKHPAGKPERPYRIGLNETKLGIVAPPWFMASYYYVVGKRQAERLLQLGETPTAEEALKLGMVDKVVEEDQVIAVATKEVERLMAIPNEARWMSKDLMRQETLGVLATDEARKYDLNFFGNMITNESTQKSISQYLERLSGASKKK